MVPHTVFTFVFYHFMLTEKLKIMGVEESAAAWFWSYLSILLYQLNRTLNGLKKVCVNASFGTKLMVANGVVMSKL